MANQHHAALVLVDGVGQGVNGLDVQVIGGLIQEEHVGILTSQPGEAHPALLAIRQVPDRTHLGERTE